MLPRSDSRQAISSLAKAFRSPPSQNLPTADDALAVVIAEDVGGPSGADLALETVDHRAQLFDAE